MNTLSSYSKNLAAKMDSCNFRTVKIKDHTFFKWFKHANLSLISDRYQLLLITQTSLDEPKKEYQLRIRN
jgi:hypothetical protein